jgi:hypothetical protein
MLTQKDREALQGDRLAAIEAEITRRKGAKKATADTARQRIRAQLDEMGARLRAAPGWVEPTAEEQERNRQAIEASFRALQRQIDARNKTGSS